VFRAHCLIAFAAENGASGCGLKGDSISFAALVAGYLKAMFVYSLILRFRFFCAATIFAMAGPYQIALVVVVLFFLRKKEFVATLRTRNIKVGHFKTSQKIFF
jgi:hypothetical protein